MACYLYNVIRFLLLEKEHSKPYFEVLKDYRPVNIGGLGVLSKLCHMWQWLFEMSFGICHMRQMPFEMSQAHCHM